MKPKYLLLPAVLLAFTLPAAASQYDGDNDGVPNIRDLCPNTPNQLVNAVGCPRSQAAEPTRPAAPAPSRRPATAPAPAPQPRPAPPAKVERPEPAKAPARRSPRSTRPAAPTRRPAAPATPATPATPAPAVTARPAPPVAAVPTPPPVAAPKPEAVIEPAAVVSDAPSVTVYFGRNQSRLTGDASGAIEATADRLKANPFEHVTIYGYTADSGDMLGDLALAQARAKDVQRVLVVSGVSPDRIALADVGDYASVERPQSRGEELRLQRALIRFHQGDF